MSTQSVIKKLTSGIQIGVRNTAASIQFAPNDPAALRGPGLSNPSQWRFITGAGKPNVHVSGDGSHAVVDDGLTFTGLVKLR